jgi:hypothetical protein
LEKPIQHPRGAAAFNQLAKVRAGPRDVFLVKISPDGKTLADSSKTWRPVAGAPLLLSDRRVIVIRPSRQAQFFRLKRP